MSLVESTITGSVMTITLRDEARRNALSDQLLVELVTAIDDAENNASVRVVVLTNRGSTFCAGANLAERSTPSSGPSERVIELGELFSRIQRSPLPFVGRLAGHCVAGGVGLAAVLDVSIALETATFGFSEVRIGVAPAIISVVCLAKMPLAEAKNAFLRGHRFSAADAVKMGLINASVALDQLDDEVTAVLNDLLAGEPRAIAAAKQLTHTVPSMSEEEAYAWTTRLSAELFHSDAAREGMTAFLEKRPPPWVTRVDTD
jgi:methylglutaconyl-CoA hydratase